MFKTGFARFSHRSVVLPLPHKIPLCSILRGPYKNFAAQSLIGFPQFSFPAKNQPILRTLYTKWAGFSVEVFACPAHVRACKQDFPFFDRLKGRVAKREVATRPYFVRKSCYRLEIVENSRRYSEKSVQKASPRGYSDAKCGKVFDFCIHAVIFSDTRVFSLPCSRFIHSFFRSKAIASKNSSARIFALPRVRNRRKAKSFFKSPNAPST